MAGSALSASSTHLPALQIGAIRGALRDCARLAAQSGGQFERWLDAERDQLVLWLPVALGAGVALWFLLPDSSAWAAVALGALAIALLAVALGRGGRAARVVAVGGVAVALGIGLIWLRAERVAHPVLREPAIVTFLARVERVEPLSMRDLVRVQLAPLRVVAEAAPNGRRRALPVLPPRVRVNLATLDVPVGLASGATLRLSARLMPPPTAAVPGAYDYARTAWFDGIGATGRGFGPIAIVAGSATTGGGLRMRLSQHIQTSVGGGGAGGIAAALVTGDQGSIPLADSDAMRRSGLAHLLSVSGLHITAAVGAVMLLVSRLLALSPWLALRMRVPLIAAAAGALAAIGYTLLTGAAVPTIRSCVAALLVLVALALGREALTLRLVAAGATIVLLLFPEALGGPSFQLSFAAVAAIVALHEHPRVRDWFGPREQSRLAAGARAFASLLLTGIVVELALVPISLFHFHKAGLYGAIANIVAIPLTTFVTMPLEALALLFDAVGAGAPFWWLTARSLDLLLWIAHATAAIPGSVAPLPAMPAGAYGVMVAGGLWIALWRTQWRRLGALPLLIGAAWALATPPPDLLVTGDGRHVAIRTADGGLALLRDRTGDYTADTMAENGGITDLPVLLSEQRDARCSRDLCLMTRMAGGRQWRVLATRSGYLVPTADLVAACAEADIVISERRLPRRCAPHWLRLDRPTLARTGGIAIAFPSRSVRTVRHAGDRHPWIAATDAGVVRRAPRWRRRGNTRQAH
ncbi:ComEC/Rec2 family competence protein [Sphingomonas sp. RB3P16]|uniref:ComEC/Rec2 family competence protein n=1 Tax=Parasphingomonas frigoris TaxID=3096163 RepID=UPI002FCB6371